LKKTPSIELDKNLFILQLVDKSPVFVPLEITYLDDKIEVRWNGKSIDLTKDNLSQIVTNINLDHLQEIISS